MTIEFVDGCLLDAFDRGDVNVIAHVVNCKGVMGSGIAKSIKDRYPKVFEEYKKFCKEDSKEGLLGRLNAVYLVDGSKTVWNLFAQLDYGRDKRHLNYGALGSCLYDAADYWSTSHKQILGFPYLMGCDRAGGDFSIVLEMIEFYFKDHEVKIYKI